MGCDESKPSHSATPQGTLTYFDGHGRAETIRLMLKKADVNFIDNRLQQSEWPALKPNFPPGGLPCWEEDYKNGPGGRIKMNETNALGRYLAKKFGFHPMNPKQAWDVDATFDAIYGQWGKLATIALMGKHDEESQKTYLGAT